MDNRNADSEYYYKAARIIHTLKYVVLLVLIVFVIIGFTSFKHELTYENFRYIMRYVNFNPGADYLDTSSIGYNVDEDSSYGYLKGDLAILSDKNFRTYDFSGTELINDKVSLVNPCMKTAGKYALCYDVSGAGMYVYNSFAKISEKRFDYGIKDACIRSDGSYAVATAGKFIRSKVSVFEDRSEFSYETRDKEVVAVSLPEDSDKVNFIALTVENGDFKFYLMSFNTRNEKPVVERAFIGEFPLKLHSTKDAVCILTDKALHFVDYNGTTIASYPHNPGNISSFYQSGNYVALSYNKNVTGLDTVRIFTADGKEIASDNFENGIVGFSAFENVICSLEKGRLHIMEAEPETGKVKDGSARIIETDRIYTDVFATAHDEYVLVSLQGAILVSGNENSGKGNK